MLATLISPSATPRRRMPLHAPIVGSLALLVLSLVASSLGAADTPAPQAVTIAGSLQSEIGCADDWQPDCVASGLAFDAEDQVWQGAFALPAGGYEYKAALNGSWDENYGANAQRGGSNIPLVLDAATTVRFFYDHESHWVTDDVGSVIATVPGSFQSELGCPGDWQPDCLRSWLQDPDGDGTYAFSARLPAGSYEAKVAIDQSWSENYGDGGVQNGSNIPFVVPADCTVTRFSYDPVSHVLTITADTEGPPQPTAVTIAGSLQSELGCPGDWQPDCAATMLVFDADDQVWQATFTVPTGSWEYKAPLDGSWDVNYGAGGVQNGPNIPLSLADTTDVAFFYSHQTHWVTDDVNSVIATVPGSFQSELGCPGDWQPDCLRSWLQDPDGDGVYTFTTAALPAGEYEAKVAIDQGWDENYGAGGVPGGPNIAFSVPQACGEITFSYDAASHVLTIGTGVGPRGNLRRAQAYWVGEDLVAWNPGAIGEDGTVSLHYAESGGLALDEDGVSGGIEIPLTRDPDGLPEAVRELMPHIASLPAFRLPVDRLAEVETALRGQAVVASRDGLGMPVDATALQIQGLLDDLYAYDGPLGATFAVDGAPTLRLWAPTAQAVRLHRFADADPATASTVEPMTLDPTTGVWSITGEPDWYGQYYRYEVEVFVRSTGAVETNLVTDPYSVSLSRNSQRSQLLALDDATTKPAGWDSLVKPRLDGFADVVLYELHVRDFSATDETVPETLRGTFAAFTVDDSAGMTHLAALADAGLTHVHLLPFFDIATIDEDTSTWLEPEGDLASFPPDSEEQQARVTAVRDADGFNWGYDPWHYTVPEGSYATDPNGPTRIREARSMVQALADAGLRVVMDVVYNHTNAAGQNERSVLDRIVPGYYHRLNADGNVETSTCCPNTASEFRMMERLLIDSAVTWARQYKVDGFRFDLMGHHMKRNLLALRDALDALTLDTDGVDGSRIFLYGEGWNFGEVANDARGEQASQLNMGGTGIATFSDRLRDGARGGGPFSGIQEQGFLTGLWDDPNATDQGSSDDQLARLLHYLDWIRLGLLGNLRDVVLENAEGELVTGAEIDYNGQPAGYTEDPQEVITYVEAHDNETLFDAIQAKAPRDLAMAERVRMHNLGISLVGLGHGVPFFHAGVELLRSKSLDRNSYNSGDWFNAIDWSGLADNWGKGLPPAGDNQSNWPVMQPLLADPALAPTPADIAAADAHFREILAIRKSSELLHIERADDLMDHVFLRNTGPDQLPGLVVVDAFDLWGAIDHQVKRAVTFFNMRAEPITYRLSVFPCASLALHPLQVASADPVVRTAALDGAICTFTIPGRTAAVFWQPRGAVEQIVLLRVTIDDLVDDGQLTSGRARQLDNLLRSAQTAAYRGQDELAQHKLESFIDRVESFVAKGYLTATIGEDLIADATAAIDAL